jgi:hypothetical protein
VRALEFIVTCVGRLEPGQRIDFSDSELREIETLHHNGATFTPADRVLENIIGSSYEFRYTTALNGRVTFERLSAPLTDGRRSYVSPDRR